MLFRSRGDANDESGTGINKVGGCGIWTNRSVGDELLVIKEAASPTLGHEGGCLGIDIKQVLPFALRVIGIAGGEEAARDVLKLIHSWVVGMRTLCKGWEVLGLNLLKCEVALMTRPSETPFSYGRLFLLSNGESLILNGRFTVWIF